MELTDLINSQIQIKDIAEEFDIELNRCMAGNFSHKIKCPNPDHKGGAERTPSCYIDDKGNSFHCFGCGAGNKAIHFFMLCTNLNFKEAIIELKGRIDIDGSYTPTKRRSNNFGILLQISDIIRKYIYNNPKDLDKVSRLCEKVDSEIEKIGYEDIRGAGVLLNKVTKALKKNK